MQHWDIEFSRQAIKDMKKARESGLGENINTMIAKMEHNPFSPQYEKLRGDLSGFYSRRITIQHRMVYQVSKKDRRILVLRLWSHYE
jgi:Txe/YoeB family toxin of toxin-antitoxin system